MDREQFKQRTKQLALRIIRLSQAIARSREADVIGGQLLRSGTSIGANYRAACRAKSTADYINKLKIVEEEADETLYWLELLVETKIVPKVQLAGLIKEVDEIVAMTVSSIKTSRSTS
ncbi:MAG: four helix bundle protein [Chloroflexi bacterium]|nr:four helix bundle protein [Chloroflexota bacterium]